MNLGLFSGATKLPETNAVRIRVIMTRYEMENLYSRTDPKKVLSTFLSIDRAVSHRYN